MQRIKLVQIPPLSSGTPPPDALESPVMRLSRSGLVASDGQESHVDVTTNADGFAVSSREYQHNPLNEYNDD